MIIFFSAYLISFFIGWFTLLALIGNSRPALFSIFLALGLGLGISSQLTFYSFLILGQFQPSALIGINLSVLFILLLLNLKLKTLWRPTRSFSSWNVAMGLLFIILFPIIYAMAASQPFGQWDSWAVWNMKTKFLVFGGPNWKDIFKLHWHTQPDYPLLLPFINAWVYSIPQKYFIFVPALTGMFFTLACAGLLYVGLAQYIPSRVAALSAVTLTFVPVYISGGTSQYADIIMAYYLLAAAILLVTILREKKPGFAVILGMILGFLSFSKNEGIVAALLLLLLATIYLIKEQKMGIIPYLFLGHLLTLPPILILKFHLAPPNRDIGLFALQSLKYFNREGCQIIFKQLSQMLFDQGFMYLLLILLMAFLLEFRRYFHKETKVLTLFFLSFGFCIFLIYLMTVNFDLSWRLSRTLGRIFAIQLPAMMFLHFYAYWRE